MRVVLYVLRVDGIGYIQENKPHQKLGNNLIYFSIKITKVVTNSSIDKINKDFQKKKRTILKRYWPKSETFFIPM